MGQPPGRHRTCWQLPSCTQPLATHSIPRDSHLPVPRNTTRRSDRRITCVGLNWSTAEERKMQSSFGWSPATLDGLKTWAPPARASAWAPGPAWRPWPSTCWACRCPSPKRCAGAGGEGLGAAGGVPRAPAACLACQRPPPRMLGSSAGGISPPASPPAAGCARQLGSPRCAAACPPPAARTWAQVTLSDWAAPTLSTDQIRYAALDAALVWHIHRRMQR